MTPVLLELATAQRLARAAQTVEDWPVDAGQGPSGGARLLASVDGLLLGAVQTDFQTGTQISVKSCDANGNTTGSAFNVYVYAGGGSADLTAVTVAGASATATCKLSAGAIIAYAFSGADAYMLGDVAQVLKDWWVDSSTGKVVYAVYWRVGQAVSTVSNVEGPDTQESDYVPCS